MLNMMNIIAIGSSAGGLKAIQNFLKHLPALDMTSVIIAQHISPDRKSRMVELLQGSTSLSVVAAANGDRIESGKVYVTPPNCNIQVESGCIRLDEPPSGIFPKPSVDVLFRSLVQDNHIMNTFGLILSGTGSDGAQGAIALKDGGGIILVQDLAEAEHTGMPKAALQTGIVDQELTVAEMGAFVRDFLNGNHPSEIENDVVSKIIELLDSKISSNFNHYKRASVMRRVEKRAMEKGFDSLDKYYDYLKATPSESQQLYESILIGVTSFFRDEEAFKVFEREFSELVSQKSPDDSIRIWIPGCSTGEEVYSIAMIASEICEKFNRLDQLQVFGTDIDERAVRFARNGEYSKEVLSPCPPDLLEKYFFELDKSYQAHKSLRSRILFSRHDIINNPPFLRQDVISCRNLLIYFDQKLQQDVIPTFHYSLINDGILFLGRSESIGGYNKLFEPIDQKNKIYKRLSGRSQRELSIPSIAQIRTGWSSGNEESSTGREISLQERIKDTLFSSYEHPYVLVDEFYDIIETHGDLRPFLNFPEGAANLNLLNLISPELKVELRSILLKATKKNQAVEGKFRPVELQSQLNCFLRLKVKPVTYKRNRERLYLVILEQNKLDDQLQLNIHENVLEINRDAYRSLEVELAETKENLQSYIEEIETSNEELQSLNEELQSLNEELQSSNEELETSNEELQSMSQEVRVAYNELKNAFLELKEKEKLVRESRANSDALLNNKLQSFLLVDDQNKIIKFNDKAASNFSEVYDLKLVEGKDVTDYLPEKDRKFFAQNLKKAMKGTSILKEYRFASSGKTPNWFQINFTPVETDENVIHAVSIGMLDITELEETSMELSYAELLIQSVFNTTSFGISITDAQGEYMDVNAAYCNFFGYSKNELVGQHFNMVVPKELQKEIAKHYDTTLRGHRSPLEDVELIDKKGKRFWVSATSQVFELENGESYVVTFIENITEKKVLEAQKESFRDALPGATWQYRIFPDETESLNFVSEGVRELWGVTPEEAMADINSVWSKIHPEDWDHLMEETRIYGELLQPLKIEFRMRPNDEKVVWLRMLARPERLEDNSLLWNCIAIDITQEKHTQMELRDSERKLSQAIEIANIGYWVMNISSKKLSWSSKVYEILEIDPDKFDPQLSSLLEVVHPADLDTVQNAINRCLEEGEPYDVKYRILARDKVKWIHARGVVRASDPNVFEGTVLEITDQVEEEQQLRLLEGAVTQTGDLVMITTTPVDEESDVEIIYVNQAFVDKTGYTLEEVIGKSPKLLQGPKSNFEELHEMKKSMLKWEPYEVTTINYTKSGEEFWNNFKIFPVQNHEGEYTHWIAIERDVTENKRRERQRELLNEISLLFDERDELKNVLTNITQKLVEEEDFEIAEVWLVDTRKELIELKAKYYADDSFSVLYAEGKRKTLPARTGISGKISEKFQPILIRDVAENEEFLRRDEARQAGINSIYAIPLVHGGKYIGAVLLGSTQDFADSSKFDLLFENFTGVLGTEILRKKLEEDLRNIYNSVPAVIAVSDLDKNIIEINQAGAEMLGYTVEELVNMNWMDLVHPDDREATRMESIEHKKNYQTTISENRNIKKNGEYIWLSWSIKPDKSEGVTFAVGKNITKEKELLSLLEKANRIAKMGAWSYDVQTDKVFWSNMACKINKAPLDYAPENLEEKLEWYPDKEHRKAVENAIQEAIEKHRGFDLELEKYTYDRTDKKWIRLIGEPLVLNGKCIAVDGTIQDVDNRRKAEDLAYQSLREKEEVLESIGDGFFNLNASFQVMYWNHRASELLGIEREEIMGKNILEVSSDVFDTELFEEISKALKTGENGHFTYFYSTLNKYYDFNFFPEKGKRISVYFIDVTERVRNLHSIKEKNEQLKKIAWTQSHVVRAPLARIIGLIGLVEKGMVKEDEMAEVLQSIQASSVELDRVIEEVVKLTNTLE